MSLYVQRNGFTENRLMWKDILTNMISGGFKLISANGQETDEMPTQPLASFVVEATDTVDPVVAQQPWRMAVKLTADTTEVFAATPSQISTVGEVTSLGTVAVSSDTKYTILSGCIGGKRVERALKEENRREFFWHRGLPTGGASASEKVMGTMTYADASDSKQGETLIGTDPAAVPFTYTLAITDHGIALHIQVEGMDNLGCRNAWFVIQRAINADGTVVTTGKAPLFAMWSVNGGGSKTNALDTKGIMRMTVREADINTPTLPVTAVIHTTDATAVINPLQQVPFSEDGKFDFRLPQGFNTHRYSYPYELDMIGYSSADVISNGVDIQVQVYGEKEVGGEAKKRTYIALSANNPDNTGMRLFMLKKGGSIA